jgi:iron complex outermembrane receptor protein
MNTVSKIVCTARPARRAAALLLALGGVAASTGAFCAETASLEEIVVTAERREMALQDTPMSVVALSGEALQAKGVDNLMELSDFTPNLSIKGGRTGGNNAPVFSIRGIGGGGGATGERGVALYIDGIYVPRTSGSVFKVFEIERSEVLRGPQGTLFGRNSEGGAIRLFTRQPTDQFDAYVRGTLGNYSQDISAMVNVPVGDKLAIRAQAAYLDEDGYVKRATQELGGSKTTLARVQAAYSFTDNVKLTIGGMYSDSQGTGSPQDIISFDLRPNNVQGNYSDWLSDALVLAGQAPLAVLNDPRVVLDNHTMPSFCFIDDFDPDWDQACALKDDNKYWQADANLQWDISDNLQFSSITGYTDLKHDSLSDGPLLGFQLAQDIVGSTALYQEFQLNAKLFSGKVDFVTGLNYFREESESGGTNYQRRGTSTYSAAGGAANGNANRDLVITHSQDVNQTATSYGWFNSATWHITDKLNLTGGGRFAWDKKDLAISKSKGNASDTFTPVPGTLSTDVAADHNWNAFDWRGTLDYHFTPDIMAYATGSKAYKAGAYSYTVTSCTGAVGSATCLTGAQQSAQIQPIPPENVVNMEAGVRATFLDGRLRINPTGYYMAWTDRQTAVRVNCPISPECPQGSNVILRNSGNIDLYGMELDAQFAVTDSLVLDGAYGTTVSIIHDEVANGGPNLFPPQASPTFYVGATYNLRENRYGHFTFNVNYSYTADQETYPESSDPAANSDGFYLLPSYSIVNARVQWTSSNGANSVSLFANNLLDKDYANFGTKFGGGFWDTFNPGLGQLAAGVGAPLRNMVSVSRSRPLEIGITYQYNFGAH